MTIGSVLIPRFALLAAVGGRRELLTEPIALAPRARPRAGRRGGQRCRRGVRDPSRHAGFGGPRALPAADPPPSRPGPGGERMGADPPQARGDRRRSREQSRRRGLLCGRRPPEHLGTAPGGRAGASRAGGRDPGPDRGRPEPLLRPGRGDDGARRRGRRAIRVVAAGGGRDFLAPLPVDLLDRALRDRIGRDDPRAGRLVATLERLGVKTLGDLAGLPRVAIADRFGAARPAGARPRPRPRHAAAPADPPRGPRPGDRPAGGRLRSPARAGAGPVDRAPARRSAAGGPLDPLAQPRGAAGRRRQLERDGGDAQRQQLGRAPAPGARPEARQAHGSGHRAGAAGGGDGSGRGRAAEPRRRSGRAPARAARRGGPAGPGGGRRAIRCCASSTSISDRGYRSDGRRWLHTTIPAGPDEQAGESLRPATRWRSRPPPAGRARRRPRRRIDPRAVAGRGPLVVGHAPAPPLPRAGAGGRTLRRSSTGTSRPAAGTSSDELRRAPRPFRLLVPGRGLEPRRARAARRRARLPGAGADRPRRHLGIDGVRLRLSSPRGSGRSPAPS